MPAKKASIPRFITFGIVGVLILTAITYFTKSCFYRTLYVCGIEWKDIFIGVLFALLLALVAFVIVRLMFPIQKKWVANVVGLVLLIVGLLISNYTSRYWLPYFNHNVLNADALLRAVQENNPPKDQISKEIEERRHLYRITNFHEEPVLNENKKISSFVVSFDIMGTQAELARVGVDLDSKMPGSSTLFNMATNPIQNIQLIPNVPVPMKFRLDLNPAGVAYQKNPATVSFTAFITIFSKTGVMFSGDASDSWDSIMSSPVYSDTTLKSRMYNFSDFVSTK